MKYEVKCQHLSREVKNLRYKVAISVNKVEILRLSGEFEMHKTKYRDIKSRKRDQRMKFEI